MIKLTNILNELNINNPRKIQIGFKETDENGKEHIWINEDIVLKSLLPIFPNDKQKIEDMVEEWNDWGAMEEDMFMTLRDLIKTFESEYL